MRIALAQARSTAGDVESNIHGHERLARLAAAKGADLVVFPELSLTGYEPTLAAELATRSDDSRFGGLQDVSDVGPITIGAGVPTRAREGILITMVVFRPSEAPLAVAKRHLHEDEEPYFVRGDGHPPLTIAGTRVALAICFELSVPTHASQAAEAGAAVYLASVAKVTGGVERARETLAGIAQRYGMVAMMVNCVGPCDGGTGAGLSSVWGRDGSLLAQLDGRREGLLIFDTTTLRSAEARSP